MTATLQSNHEEGRKGGKEQAVRFLLSWLPYLLSVGRALDSVRLIFRFVFFASFVVKSDAQQKSPAEDCSSAGPIVAIALSA
jgi:hypothetical protein